MNHENAHREENELSHRAGIASDIAGYLLAAAIIGVMFALSGAFS